MRKVAAYIRVSTEEQARHGYSIESQRQVLQDYAAGHSLRIVEEFVESESAYKLGRQGFKKMVAFLRRHRDVEAVLCYKIDRISRNLQDYSTLTELMGVQIISATESLPEGATGEFVGAVQAATARLYSAQLSERVSLGLETKAKKGLWPTYAPTGYVNVLDGIAPAPNSARLIGELFEKCAATPTSIDEATAWARDRGLRSRYGNVLARSAIHGILTNPIYYGAVPWKGQIHDGRHEPLTTREVFDRVQEHLKDRSPKKTVRRFPYRGLLTCGHCGCKITAEIKKERHVYYRCTYGRGRDCQQPYHRQDDIGERLAEIIDRISLSEDVASMVLDLARSDDGYRRDSLAERVRELETEITKLTELHDDAYVDRLSGRIDEAQWVRIDRRFTTQQQLVTEERQRLESVEIASLDDVEAALELLKRAPDLYRRRSHEERARLLQTVVSNCVLTAENLVPVYRNPFGAVAEGIESGDWLGEEDSNPH